MRVREYQKSNRSRVSCHKHSLNTSFAIIACRLMERLDKRKGHPRGHVAVRRRSEIEARLKFKVGVQRSIFQGNGPSCAVMWEDEELGQAAREMIETRGHKGDAKIVDKGVPLVLETSSKEPFCITVCLRLRSLATIPTHFSLVFLIDDRRKSVKERRGMENWIRLGSYGCSEELTGRLSARVNHN
ncbi:hypothetical protein IRJ41_006255 [Triplophysa rosa]|uniref:Uncharacterized protein n=1 Tax=Triplophysa rosa TaxID=992332 RepID=A0A9W7WNE3_TRIRA|nr:hypothetical protein IRJ41_006255 [Triplophysa rosa]